MLLRVKKAAYLHDYKIKILFSNSVTKVVDFKDWIFENENNFYLRPLMDIALFQKFEIDATNYTICWPNGADFCPDVLYKFGITFNKKR